MATSDLYIEGEPEIFDDQIVPDQDDCFLPPTSNDIPYQGVWDVSSF